MKLNFTFLVIVICVAVFALQFLTGDQYTLFFALSSSQVLSRPWTILTNVFLHADIAHLFFNMLSLFMFGLHLENKYGSRLFIFVFLVSGILGSLGFMLLNPPTAYGLGASGAIYGIIGALVILSPNLIVYVNMLPLPIFVAGPLYALIELSSVGAFDNIAHTAHLFGFLGGFALAAGKRLFNYQDPSFRTILLCSIALGALAMLPFLSVNPIYAELSGCKEKADNQQVFYCYAALAKAHGSDQQALALVCDDFSEIMIKMINYARQSAPESSYNSGVTKDLLRQSCLSGDLAASVAG